MVFDPKDPKHNVPVRPDHRKIEVGGPWTLVAFQQTGDAPITPEQVKKAPKNPPRSVYRPSDYKPEQPPKKKTKRR
jgi:hypothetical protein